MNGRFASESGRSKTEWRPPSTVNCNNEEISAVFCLKPICEEDIVTDFVWISSKRQLCKLLEQYKYNDFHTISELLFLKLSYTESGIRCIETTR